MKKLLLVISVALVAYSCSVSRQPITNVYAIDYTRYYQDGGFVVSSLSEFSGHPYVALGKIMVEHTEGTNEYGDRISKDGQQMLDMLVEQAQSIGANGIVAVDIKHIDPTAISHGVQIVGPRTWYASGVAVQFEDGPTFASKKSAPQIAYDFRKAMADTKSYIQSTDAGSMFYDPETESYIDVEPFIQRYGKSTISRLQELQRSQDREDIIESTASYIITHKSHTFVDMTGALFDIETESYISMPAYKKKYGADVIDEIDKRIAIKRQEARTEKKAIKDK